jgi:predicted transposase YbfD/YdcC
LGKYSTYYFSAKNFLSTKKEHKTDRLYISDLENNCAVYFAAGLRSHWGIENKLHYAKDVSMREDRECTKDKQAAAT